MGFFDTYQDEGGVSYLSQEEKLVLIKNETPLTVERVWFTKTGGYEGKPGYKLVVVVDGEERGLSFGAGDVESRDRMLDAMIDYLDTEDEVEKPRVVLYKVKQSQLLKNADS